MVGRIILGASAMPVAVFDAAQVACHVWTWMDLSYDRFLLWLLVWDGTSTSMTSWTAAQMPGFF